MENAEGYIVEGKVGELFYFDRDCSEVVSFCWKVTQ